MTSDRPTRAQVANARAELREWGSRMPQIVKADHQWTALLGLERNPEAEELAAAGVAQHRINALYPLEFTFLVPGAIEVITSGGYAARDDSEKWRENGAYPKNIVREVREKHGPLDAETNRFVASGAYASLRAHIAACLPDITERERRAKAMALGLWYAHWGTQHLHGTRWEHKMRQAFVNTVDWVLPELVG